MKNKNLIEIIKQKGIGEYFGKCENNSEEINEYEFYVQFGLTDENKYFVGFFKNPLYSKHPDNLEKCFYEGDNKNEAKSIFNYAVEKDRKVKENKIYKIFSKN